MTNDERLAAVVALIKRGIGVAHSLKRTSVVLGIEDVNALLSALPVAERAQPQGEAVAWAYYWPSGELCRVEMSRYIDQASLRRWREVPLYAAPPPAAQTEEIRGVPHADLEWPIAPPAVPEGFVIVPKEPTSSMTFAGFGAIRNWEGYIISSGDAAVIYRAMLAAAPGGEERNIEATKNSGLPDGGICV